MFVACSTHCFARLSLDDALRTIREMNFQKADLAVDEPGPHLKPSEVAADIGRVAQKLKAANLPFAAFHFESGDPNGTECRHQLKAVCRLARMMAVPLLTVGAVEATCDLDAEVERLTDWKRISEADGVMLTVETRSGTFAGTPDGALELCRRVDGLGLTLDPSYFLCCPDGPINFDALIPHVRHVRLRDSGRSPEQFQVRVGQGEIEYGRLVTQLERCRYERGLSVDVRDVPDSPFPIEPEVRKLKYLLESLV